MTTLEDLQVRAHELSQQLAAEQVKADLGSYTKLMQKRQALQTEADSALAKLFLAKNEALAQVRTAQHTLDTLAEKSRQIGLAYLSAGPRWADQLAQVDQQIRALRPPELEEFVDWLQDYHGQLTGYRTANSALSGRNLMPMITTKATRDDPRSLSE